MAGMARTTTFFAGILPFVVTLVILSYTSSLTGVAATKSTLGSKNILVLLPVNAPSHHNVYTALSNALLERGHYITYVSPRAQKAKHPRLREILTADPFGEIFRKMGPKFLDGDMSAFQKTFMMYKLSKMFTTLMFKDENVLALKKEKFDLLITETFFFQESLLAYAHHFGCPSLALNPFGHALHLNDVTGGATNPAYVTNMFSSTTDLSSFSNRLYNTILATYTFVTYHLYHIPSANALMHEAFPDAPHIYDLMNNISLTLLNNNAALSFAVPLAPSVIEVGGIHIKPGKPLGADLKKWIEESKDGFVYFSLGSNLRAEYLPKEKQQAILNSFSKLKQRVLLKWNGEIPQNVSANLRFEEWCPQQEILVHPKLRVFVTHGGLLSTQESVYYGAPIVGMPVFGDQHTNMQVAEAKGLGVKVSLKELTTESLDAAVNEVINNPKYREQSKKLSVLFRSDPVAPLDKAVHYTELLLQEGSLKHLQPSSVHLRWYQVLLLDVLAVIAIGLYVTWRIVKCVLGTCVKCLCKSKQKKD